MRNAERRNGIRYPESLESPVRGNPHAGFGRGTLEKGRKAPRQRPTSPCGMRTSARASSKSVHTSLTRSRSGSMDTTGPSVRPPRRASGSPPWPPGRTGGHGGDPDARLGGLTLGPVVSIEPDLDRVREVCTDFDEARAEVLIPQVEVV